MAGRYLLIETPEDVARAFSVTPHAFPPRYNISPTQPIGVVRRDHVGVLEFALVQWGLTAPWRTHEASRLMPVARLEGILEKPAFQSAFKRRRCLAPASGFYFWRGASGAREPYLATPVTGGLVAFAAIWEPIMDATGSEIDRAALITAPAGDDLRSLTDRAPVIIPPKDYDRWLHADEIDAKRMPGDLRPAQADFWTVRRIGNAINDPTREGAALIAPLTD